MLRFAGLLVYFPFTILFVVGFSQMLVTDRTYQMQGIEKTATVTECKLVQWGRSGRAPEIKYFYNIDTMRYEDSHTVPNDYKTCDDFPRLTSLAVLYLPDDPTQSRIVDSSAIRPFGETIFMYFAMIATLIFCGCVALIPFHGTFRYFFRRWQRKKLVDQGVLLQGEVMKAGEKKQRRAKKSLFVEVTYHFETPDGRRLTRKQNFDRSRFDNEEFPSPGTPVMILYAGDRACVLL